VSLSALDLNLLLVLDTVLQERSVARAARRLHVTPSAISNGLAKLRVTLGDPLVTRQGRGIVPTPRAKELAPGLAQALATLERVVTRPGFDAQACNKTFTLAMADAGQVTQLPPLVALLATRMPEARLRVVGIDALLSLGDLASADVDAHVGVKATGPGIHAQPLFTEPLVLVARKGNAACTGRLSRQRMAQLRHVAVELAPGRGFRDRLSQAYARQKLERNVVTTVSSFTAAATVAAASELVATLPLSVLTLFARKLGLVPVEGPVPRYAVTMSLCWHERTHADPAMAAFRQVVREALSPREPRRTAELD